MTPGQLVKAVSIALDVPEETVAVHDRNLVVAGLRTKGGRGPSAPHVTPLDAARLLVATLASVRAKDSVETVKEFESTRFDKPGPPRKSTWFAKFAKSEPPRKRLAIAGITDLADEHSFVEALALLIERASASLSAEETEQMADVGVECTMPSATASIDLDAEYQSNLYFGPAFVSTVLAAAANPEEAWALRRRRIGVRQTSSMGGNALLILGLAFRDNGLPYETAGEALDVLLGSKKAPAKSKKKVG